MSHPPGADFRPRLTWQHLAIAGALLIDAVLVVVALRAFPGADILERAFAWAWTVVIGGVALAVLRYRSERSIAFAMGLALAMAVGAVWLWGWGRSLGSAGEPGEVTASIAVVAIALLVVQAAIIAVGHLATNTTATRTAANALAGFFAMALIGLALAGIGALARPFAELALGYSSAVSDSVLTASVARVQACAQQYRAANPARGYPADLRTMGPGGSGCLDAAMARGRQSRVRVEYSVASADSAGRVESYTVISRATTDSVERMAFGDATGFIRGGPASAHPATLPLHHGSLSLLRQVRACAEAFRDGSSTSTYPRTLGNLEFATAEPPDVQEHLQRLGCGVMRFPRVTHPDSGPPTRMTYTPIGDAGPVTDYVVELRPRRYGIDGIRSYRATARGPVHVTLEDRAATEADPVVPHCEYDLRDYSCAPHPGGIAPDAVMTVGSTVSIGVPFTVTVRDARAPDRVDAPLQVAVECSHRPAAARSLTPFDTAMSRQCVLQRDATLAWNDSTIVRAWVRDRAGSVVILADTVTIVQPGVSR